MKPPTLPVTPPRARPSVALAGAALLLLVPLARAAESSSNVPMVAVAAVVRQDLARELAVQAEFKPYQEIDLHAKVAGYLQELRVDLGDTVKAGDVIATLEVPELREDVARSEAAVRRAEAGYKDAHLALTRLATVRRDKPDLVAQQDLDAAETKDAVAAAALAEAKADREKVRAMESYTRIVAPFGGVITKRYADRGALIQAGTSSHTQAMPIVRLSQNDRLRLVFPLSVAQVGLVKTGDSLECDLGERLGKRHVPVARFSGRITSDTRTMLGEADVANDDLAVIPGMYVTVSLQLERRPRALSVPVEAVAGTKEPTAFVVNAKRQIEERKLKLGIETPTRREVLAGLSEGDLVMIGSRSQVHVGQEVSAKRIDVAAAP